MTGRVGQGRLPGETRKHHAQDRGDRRAEPRDSRSLPSRELRPQQPRRAGGRPEPRTWEKSMKRKKEGGPHGRVVGHPGDADRCGFGL